MDHTPMYRAPAPRLARRTRRDAILALLTLLAITCAGAGLGQGLALAAGDAIGAPPPVTHPAAARDRPTGGLASQAAAPEAPPPAPSPAPPTPTPAPADLLGKVVAAEDGLQSGQFNATIAHGDGKPPTEVSVRFRRGTAQQPGGINLVTVYHGATGSRTSEYVMVGERFWQRQADGPWQATSPEADLWQQLATYLPQLHAATDPTVATAAEGPVLRWQDAERGTASALVVDPQTGRPRQLRRVAHGLGVAITVDYVEWNTPVRIAAPTAR